MKKLLLFTTAFVLFVSCHENLEERAARDAREFTEKYCPTPEVNNTRTDSIVFDIPTRTFKYYCTLIGRMDDDKIISENLTELRSQMAQSIANSTQMKKYKEKGYNFAYICRSQKNPSKILLNLKFTPKDYQR